MEKNETPKKKKKKKKKKKLGDSRNFTSDVEV